MELLVPEAPPRGPYLSESPVQGESWGEHYVLPRPTTVPGPAELPGHG